jgi:hypothetical protein
MLRLNEGCFFLSAKGWVGKFRENFTKPKEYPCDKCLELVW